MEVINKTPLSVRVSNSYVFDTINVVDAVLTGDNGKETIVTIEADVFDTLLIMEHVCYEENIERIKDYKDTKTAVLQVDLDKENLYTYLDFCFDYDEPYQLYEVEHDMYITPCKHSSSMESRAYGKKEDFLNYVRNNVYTKRIAKECIDILQQTVNEAIEAYGSIDEYARMFATGGDWKKYKDSDIYFDDYAFPCFDYLRYLALSGTNDEVLLRTDEIILSMDNNPNDVVFSMYELDAEGYDKYYYTIHNCDYWEYDYFYPLFDEETIKGIEADKETIRSKKFDDNPDDIPSIVKACKIIFEAIINEKFE